MEESCKALTFKCETAVQNIKASEYTQRANVNVCLYTPLLSNSNVVTFLYINVSLRNNVFLGIV